MSAGVPRLHATDPTEAIVAGLDECGAVIVEGVLSPDLLARFNAEIRKRRDEVEGVVHGLAHELTPIVPTSLALAGGFAVMGLSSIPPVRQFGLLSAAALATAPPGGGFPPPPPPGPRPGSSHPPQTTPLGLAPHRSLRAVPPSTLPGFSLAAKQNRRGAGSREG